MVYLILLLALFGNVLSISEHSLVLVVSFDGFRYNYFDKNITPTLEAVKSKGTHAPYMRNVFVTKTFPNHHSIATGLYPETHGVVANSFYDPRLKKIVKYSEEMWNYDDSNLPIWILNEKAGGGRHSGCNMWPGSDFAYGGTRPTFNMTYNPSAKWKDRVDTVVGWFLDPVTPANLVMMYFDEPDKMAHAFGSDSEAVAKQIARLDEITSYLSHRLVENSLPVNVILLSDHGMATVTGDRIFNVTHLLGDGTLVAGTSPALHVIPPEGRVSEVYSRLAEHSAGRNYSVYLKGDLLDRWHYKNNIRVPPIFVLADEGYGFDDLLAFSSSDDVDLGNLTFGSHGYDNVLPSMHPFFLAWGPRIKMNYTIAPFDNVDLYSLFCRLLDLGVPETNGSLANVVGMLVEGKTRPISTLPLKSGSRAEDDPNSSKDDASDVRRLTYESSDLNFTQIPHNFSGSLQPPPVFAVVAISLLLMGCACCITHQILKQSATPTSLQSYKLLDPPRIASYKSSGNEPEEQRLLDGNVVEGP